jgi:hypothetical protein
MLKFILVFILSTLSLAALADCSLTLKSKTATTSGAKIGDISFSKKQIEALSTQCKISRQTFSTNELIKLEELAFQKRIAKLKGSK